MLKTQAWLKAARLPTLIAGISPILISSFLASKVSFDWITLLSIFAFALLVQIGTNLSNDYFDFIKGADTKDRKGPLRVCQSGLLSLKEVYFGFLWVFFTAFLIALYLSLSSGIWLLFLGILSIFLGLLYTAGPYPLGYLGLGEAFVLFFFGPISSGISYFLLTDKLKTLAFVVGFGPGLLSCALLIINNLRDHNQDALVGKNTLVVRFGRAFGLFEYRFCMGLSSILPIVFLSSWKIFVFPFLFFSYKLDQKLREKAPDYNKILIQTCLFLWIYTICLSFGICLS